MLNEPASSRCRTVPADLSGVDRRSYLVLDDQGPFSVVVDPQVRETLLIRRLLSIFFLSRQGLFDNFQGAAAWRPWAGQPVCKGAKKTPVLIQTTRQRVCQLVFGLVVLVKKASHHVGSVLQCIVTRQTFDRWNSELRGSGLRTARTSVVDTVAERGPRGGCHGNGPQRGRHSTAGSSRVRVRAVASSSARTPSGSVALSRTWPTGNCATTGYGASLK